VDFAEIAMLVRLHCLVLALYQVHPYGADWVIISDGPAYSSILDVPEDQVMMYRRRLVDFRNLLNMQSTVSVLDLKEMTERLSSKERGTQIFTATVDHIRRCLARLIRNGHADIEKAFSVLTRGMQWNMNHKRVCSKVEWEPLWALLNAETKQDCPESLHDLWGVVRQRSTDAALGYAAFNLSLKLHNVVSCVLPSALRGTIHPKADQIAVPRLGDEYPWNGVGVVRSTEYSASAVSVSALYRLLRQGNEIVPHHIHDQATPFCYQPVAGEGERKGGTRPCWFTSPSSGGKQARPLTQ
jgi:pyoverdine/dityrosine biosynthesis protein Dit1